MEPPHKRRTINTELELEGFDHIIEDNISETKSPSSPICQSDSRREQFQNEHDVPDPQQSFRSGSVSTTDQSKHSLYIADRESITGVPHRSWYSGIVAMTLAFDISDLDISLDDFKAAADLQIRAEDSKGLAVRVTKNRTIVEIVFSSVQEMILSYTEGIKVKDIQVLGNLTCQPGFKFINMKLSDLPFLSEEELCKGLLNICDPMGTVMEVGINKSFGWFDGTGYVTLISKEEFEPQKKILWPGLCIMHASRITKSTYWRFCHNDKEIALPVSFVAL